jgi:hypothetical protein
LRYIIDVIGEFGELTGLTINVKKTQLMIVGKEQEEERFQEGMEIFGIKIVGKVTVLGVTVDRKAQELETNWDSVRNKMGNLARYWGQFNIQYPQKKLRHRKKFHHFSSTCTSKCDSYFLDANDIFA